MAGSHRHLKAGGTKGRVNVTVTRRPWSHTQSGAAGDLSWAGAKEWLKLLLTILPWRKGGRAFPLFGLLLPTRCRLQSEAPMIQKSMLRGKEGSEGKQTEDQHKATGKKGGEEPVSSNEKK